MSDNLNSEPDSPVEPTTSLPPTDSKTVAPPSESVTPPAPDLQPGPDQSAVATDAPQPSDPGRRWGIGPLLGVIFLALVILAGVGWFILQSFNTRVNTDHADHMEMSPSVHEIVHVRQKLLVGTEDTFEPMEFRDPQSNERVGFDIDLAKAIAQELNVPVEFTDINFESIFGKGNLGKPNVLTTGMVDVLIDSVTITEARKEHFLFSDPYLNVGQVAVTLKTNQEIKSKDGLKGLRLTAAPSTSNEQLAQSLTSEANLVRIEEPEKQAEAVINGIADAMIVDLTNAKGIVNNHPELKIATDPFTKEYYGIVIAKGKDDLAVNINQILVVLDQRGVLESLRQKWFE